MSQNGEINPTLAGWRQRVQRPLHEIIGSAELLIETLDPDREGELLPLVQEIRGASRSMVGQLLQMWTGWSQDDKLSGFEQFFAEVSLPLESLEWSSFQCSEIATSMGVETLKSDFEKIGETVSVLRKELASLDSQIRPAKSATGVTASLPVGLESTPPLPLVNSHEGSRLLVVDDDRINRVVLGRRLEKMGFEVSKAENGAEALARLARDTIDLVMLDIVMPELDGFSTLNRIKADPELTFIPVIMLSAMDDAASLSRCLSSGADDFVPKPYDPIVLRARIEASLDRKSLREKERNYLSRIRIEKGKSEQLLHSILPVAIANRLKAGERQIVDSSSAATVLFADIVGFTRIAANLRPEETVSLLNHLFSAFDHLVETFELEKIKTIGDAYMAVAGLPDPLPDHAQRGADMALAMLEAVRAFNAKHGVNWAVRIGMHSGPVMAGIIGTGKFAYDLWGDTVNVASRLESHGDADCVNISAETAVLIGRGYETTQLGEMELRNRGPMMVHRLERKTAGADTS